MSDSPRRAIPLALAVLLTGACAGVPRQSATLNPLGWPGKLLSTAGWAATDTEWPVLRETGRLLTSVGELVESPALLVEGVVTFSPPKLAGSGTQLLVGTGKTVTSAWNLPFSLLPGRTIDLGAEAALVNEALAFLETLPPERWRTSQADPRTEIFPRGTRVFASGRDLVWSIPGYGEVMQSAESNYLFTGLQWLVGTHFPAQERSWGFIVDSLDAWEAHARQTRVELILHEFQHQHMQMREWMLGWTLVYWPSYMATFPFTGWHGHWAEMAGEHAAGIVDRGLDYWVPTNRADRRANLQPGEARRQLRDLMQTVR